MFDGGQQHDHECEHHRERERLVAIEFPLQALEALPGEKEKLNRLCELNVIRQVRNVAADVFVQDAWARGQQVCVHGWVYSLANGLVNDLNVGISSLEDYERVAGGAV